MRVGKLRDRTAGADSAASAELTAISDQLSAAISELRELSSGIHPSILVEAGLGPALQALADTAALPVRLDTTLDGRLPDAVEAAAYFIVSESLANAAKHSGARAVTVSARCQNGLLLLDVSDDGTGGAERSRGSGLSGLADRVAALDGRLSVESPAGGGTRIAVALPCA